MAFLTFLHQKQGGGSGLPPTTTNRLGQLILNTARPAMALQTTDGAPQPTIKTAAFGPALITDGLVFPAPRDASVSSWEFMYSTNRGIGPGLFYQEPGLTSPTPSSDIMAGSFQSIPNRILLIGPDSNPQTFAAPNSALVGDTLSLGANSGNMGKRSISIGSSAQANQVISGGLPPDRNISIGQKSMSGVFSQAQSGVFTFQISDNVAIGAEAMGISPVALTLKGAPTNAVVVGRKSGLGLLGAWDNTYTTRPNPLLSQFTIVGANTGWFKKSGNDNPWGNSVFLGANNFQNAKPTVLPYDYGSIASNSFHVSIGNNLSTSTEASPMKSTLIGAQRPSTSSFAVSWSPDYCTSIATSGVWAYMERENTYSIASDTIHVNSSRVPDTCFNRPTSGYRGYQLFTLTAETGQTGADRKYSLYWSSPAGSRLTFGPYASNGLNKQITYGDAVSTSGYTVASGSFTDSSGKIYTVKNGLITSVA